MSDGKNYPYAFSNKVSKVLRRSGWKPERNVDLTAFLLNCSKVSNPVFPSTIKFLKQFGNLQIEFWRGNNKRYKSIIDMRIPDAKDLDQIFSPKETKWVHLLYEEHVGKPLSSIGFYSGSYTTLYIDPDEAIYGINETYDHRIYLYGQSVEEALENIITHKLEENAQDLGIPENLTKSFN